MADIGEGLELAPLRAKVVLDLSEFNNSIDELTDKTEELKSDLNIPLDIEIDDGELSGIAEAGQKATDVWENFKTVVGEFPALFEELDTDMQEGITLFGGTADSYNLEVYAKRLKACERAIENYRSAVNDVSDGQIELNDVITNALPLWDNLDEETQQFYKNSADGMDKTSYNIYALKTNIENMTNMLNQLGEASGDVNSNMQECINNTTQAINEETEAINLQNDSISANTTLSADVNGRVLNSIDLMKEYVSAIKQIIATFKEEGLQLNHISDLYIQMGNKERQNISQFRNDIDALSHNVDILNNAFTEWSATMDNSSEEFKQFDGELTEFRELTSRLTHSLEVDQSAFRALGDTILRTGESFNSVTGGIDRLNEEVSVNGTTAIEKWGDDWWSSATMALMGIEMVKGTFETYADDALEVQQSTIGLSHTFGTTGAESIEKFCTSANNANLSLHDVLPYAQELGLALEQYGGTKSEVAGVAEEIISMANQLDVATGGAISFDEAVDALRADIGGQDYELEELGINISSTAEKQDALNSKWHEAYSKMNAYQKEVIDMQVVQDSLNKTFGKTATYLDSSSGAYEKATAKINNDLTYITLDLLPIAVIALDKVVAIMDKIKTIADKIKSNKWLMNKIEWFSKLALAGGTLVLSLAVVGKAISMVTKRIRYAISATKDMIKLFKGASKFSEMRTGIGKVALAFKKLAVVITSSTAKITSILKTNITKAITNVASRIKPLAIKLGSQIASLIASGIEKSKTIASALKNVIGIAIDSIISSLSKLGGFIKATVIPTILDFLTAIGPIGWTLLAVIGICSLVYEAWKHNWFGMRTVIENVAKWLRSVGLGNIAKFVKAVGKLPSDIVAVWDKGWKDLIGIFNKSQDRTLQIQQKTHQKELQGAQDTWNRRCFTNWPKI